MNFNNPKILIVDDEEHVRELLSNMLDSINFGTIKQASNGAEAIEIFNEYRPDLMLLDINMPVKTGEEVLQSIRGKAKNTCVIVLTFLSDEETVKKCISLGAEYFIVKDMPLPKILNVIEEKWEDFKNKQKEKLSKKYDLNKILQEVKDEEKIY